MSNIKHDKKEYRELQEKVDHIIKSSRLLEDPIYACDTNGECFDINLVLPNAHSCNKNMSHFKHGDKEYCELQEKVNHIIKSSRMLENPIFACENNDENCLDINQILSDNYSYNEREDFLKHTKANHVHKNRSYNKMQETAGFLKMLTSVFL